MDTKAVESDGEGKPSTVAQRDELRLNVSTLGWALVKRDVCQTQFLLTEDFDELDRVVALYAGREGAVRALDVVESNNLSIDSDCQDSGAMFADAISLSLDRPHHGAKRNCMIPTCVGLMRYIVTVHWFAIVEVWSPGVLIEDPQATLTAHNVRQQRARDWYVATGLIVGQQRFRGTTSGVSGG